MGVQESGLTLEALAQRLEGLQRENAKNAQRLQTLERENTELRDEVTALRASGTRRDKLAEKRGSETHSEGEPVAVLEGRVSRRSLLSKAGAAAVAAAAAGTLLYPRQANAHTGDGHIEPTSVYANWVWGDAHDDRPAIRGDTNSTLWGAVTGFNGSGPGVKGTSEGTSTQAVGVEGLSSVGAGGSGVKGSGDTGVWGTTQTSGHSGVYGEHTADGYGVVGDGEGIAYAGVLGRSPTGTGVRGEGSTQQEAAGVRGLGKTGVWGSTTTTGYSGVYGQHRGSAGNGVVGDGKGEGGAGVLGRNQDGTGVHGKSSKTGYGAITAEHTGTSGYGVIGLGKGPSAGVLGRNGGSEGVRGEGSIGVRGEGGVIGVRGESTQEGTSGIYGINGSGIGVQGNGKTGVQGNGQTGVLGTSSSGYGGRFEGGKAQLMLKPGASAGKPTTGTHLKGEIYMDSAGTLFVCVASSTATAAAKWKKLSATAV